MKRQPPKAYEFDQNIIMAMSFVLDPDLIVVERSFDTVLDLLSDIGGLESILLSTASLILNVLNKDFLDNFLISKLFSVSDEDNFTQ
mmetsp:Transcript_32870/g.43341  ORF Transcript_32870/g.43341 Transcript_32870/m.43341 type:complete len:87 (+) Transcript_32870:130-390(+)